MLKAILRVNGGEEISISMPQAQRLRNFLKTDLNLEQQELLTHLTFQVVDEPPDSPGRAAYLTYRCGSTDAASDDAKRSWRELAPEYRDDWERVAQVAREFGQ